MEYFILFMFLIGLLVYVSNYKYIMIMLMSLEYMMLVSYMFSVILLFNGMDMYMLLVLLGFIASEGALGLGILVCIIREYGKEDFFIMDLLKC
nr:NADH dehydrogenase subunit 4l [Glomeridesmus sp. ITV8918]QCF39647.1 NADH dehydrogenase subunit 4L [Glomeridesmus spelaeus]QCF39660.1 NADH dehydrogenase subunit 4L [Glomeridesmus spelaeus]